MAKTTFTSIALFTLLHSAAAHYYFPHLIVNGITTPEFKYVRYSSLPDHVHDHNLTFGQHRDVRPNEGDYSDPDGYTGKEYPVYGEFEDEYMTDVRCGRDAFAYGAAKTETATIVAGSAVGFRIKEFVDPQYNNGIFHPGPAQVYMSASADPASDAGDGDWFKIYYLGPSSNTTWTTERATQINFTIPLATPPGAYLLRLELPFPIKDWPGHSQWYVNCAHVRIVGDGTGTPGPTIRIPDDYTSFDEGIGLTTPGVDFNAGLEWYVPPGPAVWTGEEEGKEGAAEAAEAAWRREV
ncbi:hypothetical protein PMIN06_005606 [Paraphaeosphaeria minitans]|uniref:lytic cellulose monooxygenase (C4-dehydrogenating) n=1 Tax=Paraphaeosphaeria minitans TaxID=565426 RepID=A0A9P6GB90_9PLEO|nr:endo-beta-1,4-glucanase D 10 [Paraphaeosphaeria minitans]